MPHKTLLTNEQKQAIRAAYRAGGHTQAQLATQYGVSPSLINQVVRTRLRFDSTATARRVWAALSRASSGQSIRDVARALGLGINTVSRAVWMLEAHGYIRRDHRTHKSSDRSIVVLVPLIEVPTLTVCRVPREVPHD